MVLLEVLSFNPCSGGLAVGTQWQKDRRRFVREFQSLFWWISCWDHLKRKRMQPVFERFNPCSGGLAVGTAHTNHRAFSHKGFNPCSGGLAVGTLKNINKIYITYVRFNPCSGGLAVGTRQISSLPFLF